jgi:hypothetical protein
MSWLGGISFPKITLAKPNRLGLSLLMETTTALNAADLKNYSANEVASLADLDKWAVRDEGIRRQELAEKKLAKLRKQIAAAELEMADAHRIINAANNAQ